MGTPGNGRERRAQGSSAADDPDQREARRRLITGYVTGGVLLAALFASVVLVGVSGGGDGGAAAPPAFEPSYANLEARREAAGVSTMGAPAADAHFHPRLTVYVNGEQVPIPVNIGIDPGQSPEAMASLHTHEGDGTIHVEGMAEATLAQFFEIWGVPLSSSELGPYRAKGAKTLRMWVDGEPSTAFDDLQMEDGQEIVVAYGTDAQIAAVSP
jgi:hypothetical protein